MKIKITMLILSVMVAAPLAGYSAVPTAEEVNCAAEDMQLFYYYLAPDPGRAAGDYPTKCHGGRTSVRMPAWLEKELPAMRERKVWSDPEEGKLSEVQVWQTAFSVLYELANKTQKNLLPVSEGGTAVRLSDLETDYNDMRQRFILSVDRISRANLDGSLGGRGASLLSAMNSVMEQFDYMTGAITKGDKDGFEKGSGTALKLSRDMFAQMFEAPRAGPEGKSRPKYAPEARILPGYRGISLKVSGSQAVFLKSGDRIDMLVSFDAVMGSGAKEKVTATILQNVIVIKVTKPDTAGGAGVVQLLCNPNEAQYAALSFVQSSNITLTRRADGDVEMRPMEIASFRKLFK